jgi:hypothetical protein
MVVVSVVFVLALLGQLKRSATGDDVGLRCDVPTNTFTFKNTSSEVFKFSMVLLVLVPAVQAE